MRVKRCWYCGNQVFDKHKQWKHPEFQGKGHVRTIDHVIPKSAGGTKLVDGKSNMVIACQLCNEEKDSLGLEEYRAVMAVREGRLTDVRRFWVFHGELSGEREVIADGDSTAEGTK